MGRGKKRTTRRRGGRPTGGGRPKIYRSRYRPKGSHPRCPYNDRLRYGDEHAAVRAVYRSHERENDLSRPLVGAYPCGLCGDWHLTDDPGRAAVAAKPLVP